MPTAVTHKFSLGETVVFSPGSGRALAVPTRGKISRLLPKEGTEYQYHIKFGPDGEQRISALGREGCAPGWLHQSRPAPEPDDRPAAPVKPGTEVEGFRARLDAEVFCKENILPFPCPVYRRTTLIRRQKTAIVSLPGSALIARCPPEWTERQSVAASAGRHGSNTR
jgi:hypothetical protein